MRTQVFLLIFLLACSKQITNTRVVYNVGEFNDIPPAETTKYLKVHLKDGRLLIYKTYFLNETSRKIEGIGTLYDENRNVIASASQIGISYEDCILLETNDYHGYNAISPLLMTMTVFFSGVTIPCISDPKACFGSCPTYYLHQEDSLIMQAEGFSSSIAKSMEEVDIDFLSSYKPSDTRKLKIELKNEAYETHYIRRSELIAVPNKENRNVYFGDGDFYYTSDLTGPIDIDNRDSESTRLLSHQDRNFLPSYSDSSDLNQKESIVLRFEEFDGWDAGIVITQKQSLMTTFLFYESMAQMGSKLGDLIAAFERASPLLRTAQKSMYDVLGGVEVSVKIKDKWQSIGVVKEQGPITTDTHILPVKYKGKFDQVMLTMTKGLWKIDQVSVCTIHDKAIPEIIQPAKLMDNGIVKDVLLNSLNDPETMLVTQPGTSYSLEYDLPTDTNQTLFLKTQGYYTEWMRSEWLQDEDMSMVNILINKPDEWLSLMSPQFKQVEAEMDSLFWSSKFGSNAN